MNQVSFKDPDGFVIDWNGSLYRIILLGWKEELALLDDNFYSAYGIPIHHKIEQQVAQELMVLLNQKGILAANILAILKIEDLDFISYPWEWTPTMLIDAGLHTLLLQKELISNGLTLKDASFLNIQFKNSNAIFIDLLSIKKANEYYPWLPYGQFLRHFIYTAALLKYKKITQLKILWYNLDGIDFKFLTLSLPKKSLFNLYEFFHFNTFKLLQDNKKEVLTIKKSLDGVSKTKLLNLIDWNLSYLQNIQKKLAKNTSYWVNYYQRDVATTYNENKIKAIALFMSDIGMQKSVLDIGANTGEYSEQFLNFTNRVISIEKDVQCCEIIRNKILKMPNSSGNKLWHVVNADIVNPDPSLGWMNLERKSLMERIKSTAVAALGITHHIYFTDSIDFYQQATLFKNLTTTYLIIEFIDAEDEKVKIISKNNLGRLTDYTKTLFVEAFKTCFSVITSQQVSNTREIFLFKKNNANQ